jgi:hypothetical protein
MDYLTFQRRASEALIKHKRELIDLEDEANTLRADIKASEDILDEVGRKLIKKMEKPDDSDRKGKDKDVITVYRYKQGPGSLDPDNLLFKCSVKEVTLEVKYDPENGFDREPADGWALPDGYIEEHATSKGKGKYDISMLEIKIDITNLKL